MTVTTSGGESEHSYRTEALTGRYFTARRVELAESVLGKERVYLDLNFWQMLRDVALGRRTESSLTTILGLLRSSVAAGRRICPISDATFLELMKQEDKAALATAQLVDDLSQGVTLVPLHERIVTEVAHFVQALLGDRVIASDQLAWTKLSYILAIRDPLNFHLGTNDRGAVEREDFDRVWSLRLPELIPILDVDAAMGAELARDADGLNDASAACSASMNSYRSVYEDEFLGCLDLMAEFGHQVIQRMWSVHDSSQAQSSCYSQEEGREQVFALFRTAFEQRRELVVQALPTIHIGALCHAAVRWDQRRNPTGCDLLEFQHAQAALPYCDVFLTDGPLRELLEQRHIWTQEDFACQVLSNPESAVAYLRHGIPANRASDCPRIN